MSFDTATLGALIQAHGAVARVVVAATRGSTPREVGAAMLVWGDGATGGQSGTIGGGSLEFEAACMAREALAKGADLHPKLTLGPDMGQCCGGAVELWIETWGAARLGALDGAIVARGPGALPLGVSRILAKGRSAGDLPEPGLVDGWLIEPVSPPRRPVWIYGAGHVGRAIAAVLAPLPDFDVTLIDTSLARFPTPLPGGVTPLVAANPADTVRHAPPEAEHLVLTYSHSLDLELCHQILRRDFAFAGLIGSATKWARFRTRLRQMGHLEAQISRISCPIGQIELGKHPQAIAIGVASGLILGNGESQSEKEETG